MKGDYPCFRTSYLHEDLVEHFLLQPDELAFVSGLRGEAGSAIQGMLYPDRVVKTPEYPAYYSSSFIQQHYLNSTTRSHSYETRYKTLSNDLLEPTPTGLSVGTCLHSWRRGSALDR